MKILYDTSVLVAASVSDHPKHEICHKHFNHGKNGQHEILICSHSIAECFCALTRLMVRPRISSHSSRHIIKENFLTGTKIVELSKSDYEAAIDLAVNKNLSGGTIYDLLIYVAAQKSKATKIATLNIKHFSQICSDEIELLQTF
jgi:predicted nucleic acid-binding protein